MTEPTRMFRPRKMLVRHRPPDTYGDCWRTCLAMALDLDQLDVPHFGDERLFPGNNDEKRIAERDWLASLGFARIMLPLYGGWGWDWVADVLRQQHAQAVIVITGKSPRGDWNHDVVWRDGQIIDPFTGEAGELDGPCIDESNPDARWYWACIITPALVSA